MNPKQYLAYLPRHQQIPGLCCVFLKVLSGRSESFIYTARSVIAAGINKEAAPFAGRLKVFALRVSSHRMMQRRVLNACFKGLM